MDINRWARIAGPALAAVVLLGGVIGCRGSVSMAPDPEPELPGIVGTWVGSGFNIVDDIHVEDPVQLGRGVSLITFTKSRFIRVSAEYYVDGRADDEIVITRSGGYRIESDSVIVRIDSHVDADDMVVIEETEKAYELVDENNLNLERWHAREPQDVRNSYTRDGATPPPIVGTWQGTFRWEWESAQFTQILTFRFRDDGTYSTTDDFTEGTHNTVQELTGNWQHDPDELFITLTDNTYTRTPPCDSDGCFRYRDSFAGATLQVAYAPSDRADRLVFSHYWDEMTRDVVTNTWSVNDKVPYGSYNYALTRQ